MNKLTTIVVALAICIPSIGFAVATNGAVASPPAPSGWDYCYFSSSGAAGPYQKSDIGLANKGNSAADSSCGNYDLSFFKGCSMHSTNTRYKYAEAYGTSDPCKGQAIIALVNPNNNGKVACLINATYGSINKVSATGVYIDGKVKYTNRKTLIIDIIKKCIKDGTYTDKVTIQPGADSCIIKKKAFTEAGVIEIYPKAFAPNNDGVAISFGHGVTKGKGGSFAYIAQGEINMLTVRTYAKNTLLNFQVGARSWSLEISDSFQKGHAENSQMLYLLQKGPQTVASSGNALCGQPLIKSLDANLTDVDKLLKFVDDKLSSP